MKSISIGVFLLLHISCSLFAQQSECDYYVKTVDHHLRKKVRQSFYPLHFSVNENMEVALKLSENGSGNIIELMLDFDDKSGLPMELGSTLTIKFIDDTKYSIIARTKKITSSAIYFTLVDKKVNATSRKNDTTFAEKLMNVNILSLEIIADYQPREISMPGTKATIIKKTIQCLMD